MSFSRTCASMNSRNGWVIATKASSWLILLSISGSRPFRQARSNVGAMTKRVMNSARLVSTRLAGVPCRPSPDRRKESATMNRVKLVTMIKRPGAIESTVRIATIWMTRPVADAPPPGSSALRSRVWARAAEIRTREKRGPRSRHASLDHHGSQYEFGHLAARTGGGAVSEVLSEIRQSDRTLNFCQRETVRR